jgi:AcrR family transcriptional regulator
LSQTAQQTRVTERRRQLLELGLRLFGSRPYDDISIEEISHLAGMSKGLLYHYFPSKRDFYVACLRAASAQLRRLMLPDPTLPPAEQSRVSLLVYLSHVRSNLAKVRALVEGGIGADPEVVAVVEEFRRAIWQSMLDRMSCSDDEHLLRYAVRGWIRFVEAMALEWAEAGAADADREAVIDVCLAALSAATRESRRDRC